MRFATGGAARGASQQAQVFPVSIASSNPEQVLRERGGLSFLREFPRVLSDYVWSPFALASSLFFRN